MPPLSLDEQSSSRYRRDQCKFRLVPSHIPRRFDMVLRPNTSEIVSGGPADRTPGNLDPVQLMAAEVIAHHGLSKTQDELAALSGVSRTTLFRWRRMPAFKRAVAQAGRDMVQDVVPEAYQRLVQAMRKGERWAIERIVDIDQEASGAAHDRRMERYLEVMMMIVVPAVREAGTDLSGAAVGTGRIQLDPAEHVRLGPLDQVPQAEQDSVTG